MRTTFFGLEIAARALFAQQQAIDTTSHNIANVNTPGYTRQRVELAASPPYIVTSMHESAVPGLAGTGVTATDILRARSGFLDFQYRRIQEQLGEGEARRDALTAVEQIYGEPSDSGISNALSAFWNAWQDVANHPEDTSVRQSLVEQGRTLAGSLNLAYQRISAIGADLESQAEDGVRQINRLAKQIADLNGTIRESELEGNHANDLRDQRDAMVDQLSKLVHVSYVEKPDGSLNITLGDRLVVDGTRNEELQLVGVGGTGIEVHWSSDDSTLTPLGGQLLGILDSRNTMLTNKLNDLQALGAQIIQSVNNIHHTGFTLTGAVGGDFFAGTGASDIAVATGVVTDVGSIAAATTAGGVPGDGSVALQIAHLQSANPGGGTTIGTTYQNIISGLGSETRRAEDQAANLDLLARTTDQQRESMNGVSLDEEMVSLVKYQHAYQAAARLVNVMDENLNTVINGMGLAGR